MKMEGTTTSGGVATTEGEGQMTTAAFRVAEEEKGKAARAAPATPFGLDRLVLLGILVLYTVLAGTHFFQWPPWEKILLNYGAFSHECPTTTTAGATAAVCTAQKARVAGLIHICSASMFAVSFIAGLVTDIVGPKATCLFGNGLYLLGWIVLSALPGTGIKYPIGFALMGGGGDPAFFGTLSISNLFPGHGSTVIAILGAARSLSNLIPLVWEKLNEAYPAFNFQVAAICMIIINLACVALVLLFVPWEHYVIPGEERASAMDMMEAAQHGSLVDASEAAMMVENASEAGAADNRRRRAAAKPALLTVIRNELGTVWNCLGSWLYLPVILVSVFNIVRNNFFLSSASGQLSHKKPDGTITEGPLDELKIINILAFLPGPLFGYLVDRFGPLIVMTGINSSNTLLFIALLVSQLAQGGFALFLKYAAPILAWPGIAFLLSQVYCYIAVVFPPKDLGKLAGLASCIGGLLGLLNLLLTGEDYIVPDTIGILFSALCFAVIAFLVWQLKKRRKDDAEPKGSITA